MSFILDALKKSETDRQQKSSAEFSAVPTSSGRPRVPGWLWALGLLLVINLAVLLGLMFRPDTVPPTLPSAPVSIALTPKLDEPNFAEQIAAAKQTASVPEEPAAAVLQSSGPPPSMVPAVASSNAPRNTATLPTIYAVRANGTVVLPDLHLDIHVYSDVPEDRFVFINMSKQRENSQLVEGPLVEEITPDGVVLEYRGTSFLLPRE